LRCSLKGYQGQVILRRQLEKLYSRTAMYKKREREVLRAGMSDEQWDTLELGNGSKWLKPLKLGEESNSIFCRSDTINFGVSEWFPLHRFEKLYGLDHVAWDQILFQKNNGNGVRWALEGWRFKPWNCVPIGILMDKAAVNLERLRWPSRLRSNGEFILVILPNFQLDFLRMQTLLSARVIVGKAIPRISHSSQQRWVISFSPYWKYSLFDHKNEIMASVRELSNILHPKNMSSDHQER